MPVSAYTQSYNSFSGVDIQATFGGVLIGELQGVSYSVTREKAPIYTMGSADPRSFSRGKRGIAGTLVFTVFNRSALLETFRSAAIGTAGQFYAHATDVARHPIATQGSTAFDAIQVGAQVSQGSVASGNEWELPWYPDQIPPFDITITAANEYGQIAMMIIGGVEILNEGSGMSIDDIVTEQSMTFVARSVGAWIASSSSVTTNQITNSPATASET